MSDLEAKNTPVHVFHFVNGASRGHVRAWLCQFTSIVNALRARCVCIMCYGFSASLFSVFHVQGRFCTSTRSPERVHLLNYIL